MKLSSAKLVAILLTIAGLAFSVAVTLFILRPTYREVGRLTDEIVRAHSELEAQYVNRRNLLSSADKVVAARETLGKLSGQFLPDGRELDFITAVEALAARHGVEERILLTVNPSGTGAEELKVGFDITLSGSAPGVLQTVVELERMPSLLIFDSAVVRPEVGAPGNASFLSINLRGAIVSPPRGL
jgi:hypothetical protein